MEDQDQSVIQAVELEDTERVYFVITGDASEMGRVVVIVLPDVKSFPVLKIRVLILGRRLETSNIKVPIKAGIARTKISWFSFQRRKGLLTFSSRLGSWKQCS